VSGATVKKFKDYWEAEAFVENFRKTKEEDTGEDDPDWWYAVASGRNGASNVFPSWAEASVEVVGVSGAIVKKFREFEDAMEFINDFQTSQAPNRNKMTPAPRADPPNRMMHHYEVGNGPHQMLEGEKGYRPPMLLSGPDPSAKKEDEVFLQDIGSEVELREGLAPPDLPGGEVKGLANGMIDIVALQGGSPEGGSSGGDEGSSNDIVFLGEALEEMVNQKRMDNEGVRKTDLHWRNAKRTALRNIHTHEDLRKRIKLLVRLREKVVRYTIKATRTACKRAGWTDLARVEAWAHGGYYTRIIRDTMDGYLSLHQHLLGLATSDARWEYTKVEIEHHVEEMEIIRNTHDSRLQCLCGLYCYLRDGQLNNWHSNSLQYKRNMDVYSKVSDTGSVASGTEEYGNMSCLPPATCAKCKSCLHGGGRAHCPWGHLRDKRARKEAAKALRKLSEGLGGTGVKKGKNKRGGNRNKTDDTEDEGDD
jgi:hypothetical protein